MAASAGPVRSDLVAFYGRTISIDVAIKQSDGVTAQTLVGATLLAEIRQGFAANDTLLKTMTVTVTDAAGGLATVSLPIADVNQLTRGVGIGCWRLLVTLSGATSPSAMFEGAVTVS